ncbi:MAG: peptide-methionine (R)-S-oxide reductase [Rufibacter sp.]
MGEGLRWRGFDLISRCVWRGKLIGEEQEWLTEDANPESTMFENRTINWESQQQAKGTYCCRRCGETLFSSEQKFDSKTGFPSFWCHVGESVRLQLLRTFGRERIQLLCHPCGLHLGHLFKDKRTPSQLRYCVNADSILWYPA